jgi:hypothetical protein
VNFVQRKPIDGVGLSVFIFAHAVQSMAGVLIVMLASTTLLFGIGIVLFDIFKCCEVLVDILCV